MKKKVLIIAGGTGGHIYPAMAVAKALIKKNIEVIWLGSTQGLEASIVQKLGITPSVMNMPYPRGKGIVKKIKLFFSLLLLIGKSLLFMLKLKPDCVLSFGGYITGPGGVASKLIGIPLIIHEQNVIPGITNRILAYIAFRILESFSDTFTHSAVVAKKSIQKKCITVGLPVREDLLKQKVIKPINKPLHILVLGGSHGAEFINQVIPLFYQQLKGFIEILHQTGTTLYQKAQYHYNKVFAEQIPESVSIVPYIEDMAKAYCWADIVICRSGASTIAELSVMGKPALFIPFPQAVMDHQTKNARLVESKGAGLVIKQTTVSDVVKELVSQINCLQANPEKIKQMGQAAYTVISSNATEQIANICIEVIDVNR